MDFSTDDNSYRSALAAVDFSALLQVRLKDVDGLEWVERSQLRVAEKELNLAGGGFASSATALQVGKMVKADWLVTGRFTITAQGRGLRLEVIDLEHADVLAEATLLIKGMTNQPLEVSVVEVAAADEQLRTALRQAQEHNAQTKSRTIIAPLFFANTSGSRRLDYLETELQSALDKAPLPQDVRILQFPRAAAAAAEAELIFAGLVAQDPAAWQKVADVYVWGQYEEIKPGEFTFAQTPVRFTLNLWDGSGDLQTVTETATVSELPQLEARLVKSILAARKLPNKQTIPEGTRRKVARQLMLRAADIQALFKQEMHGYFSPNFLDTAQGQQLLRYQVRLLTTAHFFTPESCLVHRFWLESFWGQSPPSFWQRLEQIRSYDDFDDKFGLISPAERESDFLPPGPWFFLGQPRTVDYRLTGAWQAAMDDVCNTINGGKEPNGFPVGKLPGFPADAPPEVLAAWKIQIRDDFARRLFTMYEKAIHADPPIPVINAHLFIEYGFPFDLKDKVAKAKFIEDLWPQYLKSRDMPTARREYSAEEFDIFFTRGLFPPIQQVFADVGRPEQAAAMIAQFKQQLKVTANPTDATRTAAVTAEAHRPKLVSVSLLPPKLSPDVRPVVLPSTTAVNGVVALKFGDGVLWVSTRGGAMNWSDPVWEYLVASHPQAALWQLPPGGTPQMLSAKIGKHSPITSFCPQGNRLWMTLEQDGVVCFSPTTGTVTRYGDKQGVLSRQMFASALAADRIFLGGGEPANGKLNSADFSGSSWKSMDFIGARHSQIRLLQLSGHHLLVNDEVYNLENESKCRLSDVLKTGTNQPMPPSRLDILAATTDPHGLWLGTTLGLVAYNPDTGIERHWFSWLGGYLVDSNGTAMTVTSRYHRSENGVYVADTNNSAVATIGPTSRLPGAVTALANDGDFLWVAATTRFDPSLNGNGTEGRWVNGYFVLTLCPGVDTGGAGKNGEWRNMYAKNERNYVLLFHKPTGKWVGYFPVTSRVTGLAVSDEKLWVGLEDTGYVQLAEHSWQDQEVFAPSPLLEIQKAPMLSVPPAQWVSDQLSDTELHARINQAIQILKVPSPPEPAAPLAAGEERLAFLQKNFGSFVPIKLNKGTNGYAAVQILPVRGHLIEHDGLYYCGFRFTMPAWLDGDLEWMYALAKGVAQKDFTAGETWWGVVPEAGPWAHSDKNFRLELQDYRGLRQQFPYSHSLNVQTFSRDQLQPGKSYVVWFALQEKDHPDIAYAMTIRSPRGTNELGPLPLR